MKTMGAGELRVIKLMADYDCHPLWRVEPGVGNLDPDSLPLSEATRQALDRWAQRYDATLDRDDPLASGFPDEESHLAFEKEGRRLWQALQEELGDQVRVLYFSDRAQRLLEPEREGLSQERLSRPPESPFPLGRELLGGRVILEETLGLEGVPGRYRGRDQGGARYLVTVSGRPESSLEKLERSLPRGGGGVAELVGMEAMAHPLGGELTALIEREPSGAPLSEKALATREALALGIELARCLEALSAPVGGLRPELVYAEGGRFSGMAPRAQIFLAATRRGVEDVPDPVFATLYVPPELQHSLEPSDAGDVFSLAALVSELLSGRHPFAGDSPLEHLTAIVSKPPDLGGVDADVAPDLEKALAKRPRDRLSLRVLRLALERALAARDG